ncbi:MAG: hypothetical protein AAFV33_07745, partial [Chloroflexota bacterium]
LPQPIRRAEPRAFQTTQPRQKNRTDDHVYKGKPMNIQGRKTAKLTEAIKLAKSLSLSAATRDELYDALVSKGYNWDGKSKTWSENNPFLGSAFEDYTGEATGHIKLRVMTHPDEQHRIITIICRELRRANINIIEVSELYPNRKGVGVRTYITGELKK